MHRVLQLFVLLPVVAAGLSGCMAGDTPVDDDAAEGCWDGVRQYTHWFGPDLGLQDTPPAEAGATPGNGFAEAFATDDMDEWLSAPVPDGLRITGNVSLEYWARNVGTPAPFMLGDPGEGYHFFNQLGSDRTFQPSYVVEYADAAPMPGSVDHHQQTYPMPEGGFFLEPGDRFRILLTSLVMDDADGAGHEILWGGDMPSQVSFEATCFTPPTYRPAQDSTTDIEIPGNRGLLTGAVPAEEGTNQQTVPFTLDGTEARLTVSLEQQGDENPVKDDMDLTILDGDGAEVWSIGSPYADESGTLWPANMDALMPPGEYAVRVDSYSGIDYHGTLTVSRVLDG